MCRILIGLSTALLIIFSAELALSGTADVNNDGQIRVGHISDIEGAIKDAHTAAADLQKFAPDLIVISGDVYENEKIRRKPQYPNSTDNVQEMVDGIAPFAELGIPIYVIPGNHETKVDYSEGISRLRAKYPNVHDITGKSVNLEGVNLVGMGGYYHPKFTAPGGFINTKQDYVTAFNQIFQFGDKDPTILITHSPPKIDEDKYTSKIDYVKGAGHAGDANITAILTNSSVLNLCGHIHEGGGYSVQIKKSVAYNGASITQYLRKKSSPRSTVFKITDKDFAIVKH